MELGVSHEQSLSSLTPIVDNIFDTYNKNLVPIRSLSDHDTGITGGVTAGALNGLPGTTLGE